MGPPKKKNRLKVEPRNVTRTEPAKENWAGQKGEKPEATTKVDKTKKLYGGQRKKNQHQQNQEKVA